MKITKEQLFLLHIEAHNYISKHQEIREGQAYMNALFKIDVELYQEITGTDKDPFYLDTNLPKFFSYLKNNA